MKFRTIAAALLASAALGVSAQAETFKWGFQGDVQTMDPHGLFETMTARKSRVLHLHQHLDRLEQSLRTLRLSEQLRSGPLAEAIQSAVDAASLEVSRVRVTITGGDRTVTVAGMLVVEPALLTTSTV